MILPKVKAPLDRDDLTLLARLVIYAVLTLAVAAVAGLAIRVFLLAAFGGIWN